MNDGQPVSDIADSDVPPNWTAPSPEPEGKAFLVGVPARAEDFVKAITWPTHMVAPAFWWAMKTTPERTSQSWDA
ncbi:hypothetical protein V7S43_018806 [Phytophthora oleae]|uniref:Uncharacterized protein n=1 Tax=Phytophthora oleae TaxID=2107226 RepID=A0ABD3ERQ9_9STRA